MKTNNCNPLTLPIEGTFLIESSAGTGKTYLLSIIYLRLLLGLTNGASILKPLKVKEILVVTFTESSTEELRKRIKDNIHKLRIACICNKSDNPLLSELLKQINDMKLASIYLLAAEREMDEAAIYTIHGFCYKILINNTMEFKTILQQTIIEDELLLYQQAIFDFWRRNFYTIPIHIACIIQKFWDDPKKLLKDIQPYLQGALPKIINCKNINGSIIEIYTSMIDDIKNFKQKWNLKKSETKDKINNYITNNKIYSENNINTWFKKIDIWVMQVTINYIIPNELERFKISTLTKYSNSSKILEYKFFIEIENICNIQHSFRQLIFIKALKEVRYTIFKEKQRQEKISFDDLITKLDFILSNNNSTELTKLIRMKYPVAMIDEFQDTDAKQYRIFRCIYINQPNCCLLLIGDPKQAIYSFRGANIFTYISARKEIDTKYTLYTNWRSTPGMINAINKLFQNISDPFIFKDIYFYPSIISHKNKHMNFLIKEIPEPSLRIWFFSENEIGINQYQQYMAKKCANTICSLLCTAKSGKVLLKNKNNKSKILKASDITVLVRNRYEAKIINDELSKLMIPTAYLSNKENVFETSEAIDIKLILIGVLYPEHNYSLCNALSTRLLGVNAYTIDSINKNKKFLEKIIKEFINYRNKWNKSGIMIMLHQIMIKYNTSENLLASQDGERIITNVLHISELLQEISIQISNKYAIIRWLELQIKQSNPKILNQQLRISSESNLVNILTIHKSKGLEFPIVFLPFIANFRINTQPLFHNRKTYELYLDVSAKTKSMYLADEERLAEDLRLLYVALTRSIYHCSIGIALLRRGLKKRININDLHLSALGYLINKGKPINLYYLNNKLKEISYLGNGDISICNISSSITMENSLKYKKEQYSLHRKILMARCKPIPLNNFWKISSYSVLKKNNHILNIEKKILLNDEILSKNENKYIRLTQHTFPRGALFGSFLHDLFEKSNNSKPLDIIFIKNKIKKYKLNISWVSVIVSWIKNIFHFPLNTKRLSISKIPLENKKIEFKFYLPVIPLVKSIEIDLICKQLDILSSRCPPLNFTNIIGMLKGSIDIVFRWENKYYILDYKSNWLGETGESYNKLAIENSMIINRYDLQYQIYTLAIHRFLKHKLINYNYNKHFGGVYYLFIRGIDKKKIGQGVFYCRPDINLINSLDLLFSVKK